MMVIEMLGMLSRLPATADIDGDEMHVDLGVLACGCSPHPRGSTFDEMLRTAIRCLAPCAIECDFDEVRMSVIVLGAEATLRCENCGHNRACMVRVANRSDREAAK